VLDQVQEFTLEIGRELLLVMMEALHAIQVHQERHMPLVNLGHTAIKRRYREMFCRCDVPWLDITRRTIATALRAVIGVLFPVNSTPCADHRAR